MSLRRAIGVLTLGALLLCLVVAAPARADSQGTFLHYEGTYTTKSQSTSSNPPDSILLEEHLTWNLRVYPDGETHLVAQGGALEEQDGEQGRKVEFECHYRQDPSPHVASNRVVPGERPGTVNVEIAIPEEVGPKAALETEGSCAGAEPGAEYPMLALGGEGESAVPVCGEFAAEPAFRGIYEFVGMREDSSKKIDATEPLTEGDCGNLTATGTRTIESTVSVGSGGAPEGVPNEPKKNRRTPKLRRRLIKEDAEADLIEATEAAVVPCAVASYGSLVAATEGGLLTGTIGDKDMAAALAAAGRRVYEAWDVECQADIRRIESDFRTAQDPPVPGWTRLAHARRPRRSGGSCGTVQGSAAQLCAIEVDQQKLSSAARGSSSIAGAIATTIDRLSGAIKADQSAAAGTQAAHAEALESQLEKASGSQSRSEGALTASLGAAGFTVALDGGARLRAGRLIAGRLAAHGITRADLDRYTHALPG